MNREALLEILSERILRVGCDHPTRVAIDGYDTAGKTTLADELAAHMSREGHEVISASIDGFHNPAAVRYRNGKSGEAYFRDSFNYEALIQGLLAPLGPGGNREYLSAVFDYRTETERDRSKAVAGVNSILLFDGVFLLRDELRRYWDFKIFVDVSLETVLERATQRDVELFGSRKAVRARYQERYIPGQLIYEREMHPKERADVIIDNNDPSCPGIL